jgi:hypothetical protein
MGYWNTKMKWPSRGLRTSRSWPGSMRPDPTQLYNVTTHTEETLNKDIRFGYVHVQGMLDNRAMVGLLQPGSDNSTGSPGTVRPTPVMLTVWRQEA